ncbi:tryptophan--tRNA ligase [Proteinivorax hydrogeniformans]|uniref:Tryptophan--tRNA ligase n=1 Tax=Proteinivorax hydrogeniformans TaxID=1826727 RepID=A0AAU8HRE9_9FIRM
MTKKKVIFSGAQPTGVLTLGNYLGAIQNWKSFEDTYNCLYSIVDLHSLTVRNNPKEFKNACLSLLAQYLACGLNPDKNTIFFQSHVPQHSELAWILNCNTYMGELNRMTQFKDKSAQHKDNINAGLFTYPALQAADILLYQTNLVPVGQDQKQHLELARDIAIRFNNNYGETFTIPEIYTPKMGAKIMSLQQPEQKMSKSDENPNGTILILDEEKRLTKKMKKAVTDNEGVIRYRDEQPGVKNLITIYSKLTELSVEEIENKYDGKGYGHLKVDLAEIVTDTFRPIQEAYANYMDDLSYLEKIYTEGALKAQDLAEDTMKKVRKNIGLV